MALPAPLNPTTPVNQLKIKDIPAEFRSLKVTINQLIAYLDDPAMGGGGLLTGSFIYNPANALPGYINLKQRVVLVNAAPSIPGAATMYLGTDYQELYETLWPLSTTANFAGNATVPAANRKAVWMVDTNNTPVTPSADATTDWAAGRQLVLDFVGVSLAAAGTPNLSELVEPTTDIPQGQIRGNEKHVLSAAELPAHSHTVPINLSGSAGGFTVLDHSVSQASVGTVTSSSVGSNSPHSNLPPRAYIYLHVKI